MCRPAALLLTLSLTSLQPVSPVAAQGSQAAAPQPGPAASAPVLPEIRVLDQLIDRSGAIASVGIINRATADARLAGSALICVAKGATNPRDQEFDTPWLFAAPLWHRGTDNIVRPGANVFDLSVQGYELQNPTAPEARRHFDYVFTMIRIRTLDLANGIVDPTQARKFRQRGLEFASALADATRHDVASQFEHLRSFDDFLDCYIRVKTLSSSGAVDTARIPINAIGLIFWLANYVRPEHGQMVEEFARSVDRQTPG